MSKTSQAVLCSHSLYIRSGLAVGSIALTIARNYRDLPHHEYDLQPAYHDGSVSVQGHGNERCRKNGENEKHNSIDAVAAPHVAIKKKRKRRRQKVQIEGNHDR